MVVAAPQREGSVQAASQAGAPGAFLPLTKAGEGRHGLGLCTQILVSG